MGKKQYLQVEYVDKGGSFHLDADVSTAKKRSVAVAATIDVIIMTVHAS